MLKLTNEKVNPLDLSRPGLNEEQLKLEYIDLNANNLNLINGVLTSIIPGFKRYTIDVYGNVYDTRKNEYVKTRVDHKGYIRITICNDNKMNYEQQLHRLVLKTFRPVVGFNYYQVNHIDKNPANNRLDNLEWVTNGINKQHAHIEKKGGDNSDAVGLYCRNVFTGEVIEFIHLFECAAYLKVSKDTVANIADMPNKDYIHSNGWQVKRKYLKYKWPEITDKYIDKNLANPPYTITYIGENDENIYEFSTLTEAAMSIPCSVGSLSMKMSEIDISCPDYIPAIYISNDKGVQKLFYLKRKYDTRRYKEYPTIWHAYEDASNVISPVVRIDKNGNETIYTSLEELSKSLGIGKTTAFYRLATAIDPKEWKYRYSTDGYIYAHYTTWYNLKSTKNLNDFAII